MLKARAGTRHEVFERSPWRLDDGPRRRIVRLRAALRRIPARGRRDRRIPPRRPADAPALPRHAGDRDRHRDGGARRHRGQRRAAEHRRRARRLAIGLGLGDQRLSAHDRRAAAAARVARRAARLSPDLPGRGGGLHGRLARLRALREPGFARRRPRRAGGGRRRDHEHERRAGPAHLPGRAPRPRHRPERAGRRPVGRRRPVARLGHPRGRSLALALRDQRALRPDEPRDRPAPAGVGAVLARRSTGRAPCSAPRCSACSSSAPTR